jgi:PAB-dependent poly(A)-specific ribonuclease subunit 3
MATRRKPRLKKSLNVDSPTFTPATLPVSVKGPAISSHAANAAPFTPRGMASGKFSFSTSMPIADDTGTATPNSQLDAEPAPFNPAAFKEFTPANYDIPHAVRIHRD